MKRINKQARCTELRPDYIGTRNGIRYFEHPVYGDEHPLLAKIEGVWFTTDELELPDHD